MTFDISCLTIFSHLILLSNQIVLQSSGTSKWQLWVKIACFWKIIDIWPRVNLVQIESVHLHIMEYPRGIREIQNAHGQTHTHTHTDRQTQKHTSAQTYTYTQSEIIHGKWALFRYYKKYAQWKEETMDPYILHVTSDIFYNSSK